MNSHRMIQIGAVAIALIALIATALFVVPFVRLERKRLNLGASQAASESVKPDVAFASSMLGPLKGFMVNALWYRVEELKQQGKFAEINELSRMITTLQPRFPEVWRFHAWNMAYNVSVQTFTPQERWDWVNKGIRLLREEGIPANPTAVKLYRELSWIFFHKFGQYSDDAHWYYKVELCREWQEILGVPAEGRDTAGAIAEFKKVVDAPDTLSDLIAQYPLVRTLLDEQIAPADYQIESGVGDGPKKERERLLRSIGKVLMYNFTARIEELPTELRPLPPYDEKLLPMLRKPANRPAVAALLNHLRKRVLIENYHMDPVVMLEIMNKYGPVDFRCSASHSLYWSHMGVKMMKDWFNNQDFDRINTMRSTIHSLQDLTDSGRLLFFPDVGKVDTMPDTRFIPAYEKALEDAEKTLSEAEHGDNKPYQAGHENFLLKAFVLYYQSGDMEQARKYREKAKKEYSQLEHNVRTGRYQLSMDDHFTIELLSLIENNESLRAFVYAMSQRAFSAIAINDMKAATQTMKLARDVYDAYMKNVDKTSITEQDRMAMAPGALFNNNFIEILRQPSLIEFRARLWQYAPLSLRQAAWDAVNVRLKTDAEAAKLNPDVVFPEPEGMAAYRAANPTKVPAAPVAPTTGQGTGPLR